MDVQELVREVIREEVRAMLYGHRLKRLDPERLITITHDETHPLEEPKSDNIPTNEEIEALIERAMRVGGFSSKKELFYSMYDNNESKAWNDLSNIKRVPHGRTSARLRMFSELQKVLRKNSK